jgi:broad specificity phosphatase PhoE
MTPVQLLVRHADAGDRAAWRGDDRDRPLSPRGWRQAEAVVVQLADHPIERILSSPLTRCVQTVEPLATTRGLTIEEEDALAEGMPLDVVQRLLRRLGDTSAVLCTHGDVIELLVTDLAHRGVVAEDALRWRKGSTWVLEGAPEIHRARYLPPPV